MIVYTQFFEGICAVVESEILLTIVRGTVLSYTTHCIYANPRTIRNSQRISLDSLGGRNVANKSPTYNNVPRWVIETDFFFFFTSFFILFFLCHIYLFPRISIETFFISRNSYSNTVPILFFFLFLFFQLYSLIYIHFFF